MRKRIGASMLCFLLAAVLISCVSLEEKDTPDGDYETVVMIYQTMAGSNTAGLDEVVKAINEISREAIGVEVELKLVDAVESASLYPVWLSQGERIDLVILNYLDITSYVTPGYLTPLDGLLEEYGQGILALREQGMNVIGGAAVDGKIYGVNPLSPTNGSGGGLWIPIRYLREAGFAYDPDRIYTMEELDGLFARLKALYPDKYPFGQITTDRNFSTFTLLCGDSRWIAASDSIDSGVMDIEGRSFENFYETESYGQFLSWLRHWYEAGYIYPDAAVTTLSSTELLKSGTVLSIPMSSMPGIYNDETAGEEIVCLMTSPVTYGPDNSSTGIRWVIPKNGRNPEAAMKFLNLMYTDERIVNLFAWGVEGRDYVVVDREANLIAYPKGVAQAQREYINPLGLYGNHNLRYEMESDELHLKQIAYSEKAIPMGMEYVDFTFDVSGVTAEKELVRQVLNRYLPVLESGSVDLDTVYPEFIAALKEAGIERVVAEKQRQLDEFLSHK